MEKEVARMARLVKRAGNALVETARGAHPDHPKALRPAHGRVFEVMDPEGTRLTVLADRAGMTHQAMGELVADLVANGYLERVPDPADGRARLLRATERGRTRVAAATEVLSAIHAEWERRLAGITPDQLLDGLEALITACEAIQARRDGSTSQRGRPVNRTEG